MAELISVTVVFSQAPGSEDSVTLELPQSATLRMAVYLSGLHARYPAFDFGQARWGIWGKLASKDALVTSGDRIEVYRPLVVDPKVARAKRADKKINNSRFSGARRAA